MEEAKDWTDSDPWGVTGGWKNGDTKRKKVPGAERQRYRWIHWIFRSMGDKDGA